MDQWPYKFGMILSEGKGHATLSSVIGMSQPDILVVYGVHGPLDKHLIRKNLGKETLMEKLEGQPAVMGSDANDFYAKLWPGSFLFVTTSDLLSEEGWIDALDAADESRLEGLWRSACRRLGIDEKTPSNPFPPLGPRYLIQDNRAAYVTKEEYEANKPSWGNLDFNKKE